jgi:hypothetical protein
MSRYHYAATYPSGAGMTDYRTQRVIRRIFRRIYRFETKAQRDAWVYEGNPYESREDYREAVTLRQIQQELRRAAACAPQGVPVWDGHHDMTGEVLV